MNPLQKIKVCVATLQCACTLDRDDNIHRITHWIQEAASHGAQIILPPELFESEYFCREEKAEFFRLAHPAENHPTLIHFQALARQLKVVIPISFFEKDQQAYYNSVAIINADGNILGVYRKSHIPDGPGYEEKFYFHPGNTGFKTWKTTYGCIGVGICWDQWFPEAARSMMLLGAELLLYPSAIGSEPESSPLTPPLETKDMWQRAMMGHAVSNQVPVIASNRIGIEGKITFYGHSFLTDHTGSKIAELGSSQEGFILGSFDLENIRIQRAAFGLFRDRRPDLYSILTKT